MATNLIAFGKFRIDVSEHALMTGTSRLKISPKALGLLQYLAQHAGRLVSKEELLGALWPDTHVTVDVLKTCVVEVRRALGDTADAPQFIETVPRYGYRFIAQVGVCNVPVPLTSFVGREVEIAGVSRLLNYSRLISIRGPAGVGKTRLAVEVASRAALNQAYGVWWIDLAPLVDSDLLAETVASTLSIQDFSGCPAVQVLVNSLNEQRLLLVFDNCEEHIAACSSLVDTLLRSCPNLRILTTTRETLGAAGESVWALAPLSIPESESVSRAADALAFDAVRLFVERATNANRFFTIADANASTIGQICRRLDGLPLAIELAAVRTSVLAPEEIVARLDDVFHVLGRANRTEMPRHQTLRAAFDSSYELLPRAERQLFACLSIFAGSFKLSAVESICGEIEEFEGEAVLELIAGLVDRSLVATAIGEESAAEMRYRLLGTVRQYGREKLQPEVAEKLARRHAEFYRHLAEEVESSINTPAAGRCLALVNEEYGNFRAALQWALRVADADDTGLRLAAALWAYWLRRGRVREGLSWLEAMLNRCAEADTAVKAKALCGAGVLAMLCGDVKYARRRLEESVRLWRSLSNPAGLGCSLYHLGMNVDDLPAAERHVEEAVDILGSTDHPWELAIALTGLGKIRRSQGRPMDAAELFEKAAGILRMVPDPWTLSYPLRELAALVAGNGEFDRAERYWRESLKELRPTNDNWFVCWGIEGLATVRFARGHHFEAVLLFGAAHSMRTKSDLPVWRVQRYGADGLELRRPDYESCLNGLRSALGEAAFTATWAEGLQLSRDEAITLALSSMEAAQELAAIDAVPSAWDEPGLPRPKHSSHPIRLG